MLMETPRVLFPRCYVLGSRYFPIFWLGTEPPIMVEGGVSGVIPRVLEQMKAFSLSPPHQVILLHEHPDHVSGLPLLKAQWPYVEALASPEASRFLSQEKAIEKTMQSYKETDRFFTKVLMEQGEGEEARWDDFPPPEPVRAESLPPGIHIIPTPGHSPGSMALFWEKEGALFASDSVGYFSSKGPHFPLFFQDFQLYINAIERLRELQPKFLVLGHLQYFTEEEADKAFQRALDDAFRLREKAKKLGEDGLKEVFSDIYRDELAIFYPKDVIWRCAKLLVKRSLES